MSRSGVADIRDAPLIGGNAVSAPRVLPMPAGTAAHHAAERRAKRRLVIGPPQPVGGETHAPVRQIVQRRSPDGIAEALGEGSARHARMIGKRGERPAAAGIGVHGADRPREARIGQRAEPAERLAKRARHPKAQHLQKHDLGEVIGHQRLTGRAAPDLRRELVERPAQHGGLVRRIAKVDDGRQRAEQQACIIALERETHSYQEEVATAVAGRNAVHCPVVDRGRVDRRQRKVGGKQERPTARQEEAVAGFDPARVVLSVHLHPAGAVHDSVELDALMWRAADRPLTARVKTGADRASRPQQRKDIRQRVQRSNSGRTQAGERLATRVSTKATLVIGMVLGAVGTALLVPGTGVTTAYIAIVPGLILSGIGQGIVWTGMWIAAASGIRHDEQGVASRMASTTLSVGNAIGLAVLIAVANGHAAGQVSIAHLAAVAEGIRLAFWLAAGGILVSLLAALTLPRKASVTGL